MAVIRDMAIFVSEYHKGNMRALIRLLLSFDNLMITIATCIAAMLLYVVPQNFDFLSPLSQALGDVDLTDIVLSQLRGDDHVDVDTSIVLVNIGNGDRGQIAEQLRNISRFEPAAVGLDAFFLAQKEAELDSSLAQALAATPNLVMVSRLEANDDGTSFHDLVRSRPEFGRSAHTGFANLVTEEEKDVKTCREVSFEEKVDGRTEPSFPIALATIVAPDKARTALAREQTTETINFRGNLRNFYHIDVEQSLDPQADLSVVKGKVVLMGFLGDYIGEKSVEDKFFTPMNEQYVGRSLPDMYGVVIHANVLSMILSGEYIATATFAQNLLLGMFVLVLNVLTFTYIYTRYEAWYDTLALAIQLVESLVIFYGTIVLFDDYHVKINPTPALLGVFLVGTVHDLYQDSLKKIILRTFRKKRAEQ